MGQGGRAGQAADLHARLWPVEPRLRRHAPSPGLDRHRCRAGWSSWVPAARLQKRLILEWAVRLHKPLQPQAEILECGIVLDTTEEDAEPVMLEAADEEESRLLVQAPRYVAASCGFLGHPLPGGHYYGDNSQVGDGLDDNTKVKWSKLGNNAKSAIQEQTSKTLGLRSLG